MAAANKNTIVVVQSVGPVILENILALDGVKAVVWAGLGSQESGNALVDILYGSTSPSGKLPCKYLTTLALPSALRESLTGSATLGAAA